MDKAEVIEIPIRYRERERQTKHLLLSSTSQNV